MTSKLPLSNFHYLSVSCNLLPKAKNREICDIRAFDFSIGSVRVIGRMFERQFMIEI